MAQKCPLLAQSRNPRFQQFGASAYDEADIRWAPKNACCLTQAVCARLNQPRIAAAIELKMLPVDEPCLSATQKCAGGAKFFRPAKAFRR